MVKQWRPLMEMLLLPHLSRALGEPLGGGGCTEGAVDMVEQGVVFVSQHRVDPWCVLLDPPPAYK